ncbi:MAG TPA: hypothetical protein VMS64_10050 [Candidatus Methylomirabilis sp.]|nr:hypothetical protein [Candidatus Methylomirabilis sp.]
MAPSTLTVTGDGSGAAATLVSGPTASGSTNLAAGASVTFTWTYNNSGTAAGNVTFDGTVSATDANTNAAVGPFTASSGTVGVNVVSTKTASLSLNSGKVTLVASDPFGDGTAAATLVGYQGSAWAGPSQDGSKFARLDPSGSSAPAVAAVAIGVDAGLSAASNAAWRASPPATTFGSANCAPGTVACGPDDESGAALVLDGTMGGVEQMFVGGAGAAGPRYLYSTSAGSSPLAFGWADLGSALPTGVEIPGSFLSAGLVVPAGPGRVYLGYAAPGLGAALIALVTAPSASGVDAVAGTDVVDLAFAAMPGASGASAVTSLSEVGGVLYVAHDAGLAWAVTAVPGPASTSPGDWALSTPVVAAWSAKTSLSSASAGSAPASRAVPSLASFGACGGSPCVYAIRNVLGTATEPAAVPQLWRCSPSAGPSQCNPSDWALAAANTSGDTLLSQLGDETNGAATLLVATPNWLYLGFDNGSTGIQVYRASVAPQGVGDFVGENGCVAGTAGCQGLGGNGFGNPKVTRIFDARAITVGGTTGLWIAAGDGSGPVSVYRIAE